MTIALNDAPTGQPLLVVAVRNQGLASELGKLGIRHGTQLIRLEPDVSVVQPMRIRGPKGEVILTGNMASGLVVHLDDGEIVSLLDMQPGNKGHLEGITVNPDSALADTFAVLGLKEDDTVELLRRLPPMEYAALVEQKRRISLPGGMAAKLWGLCQGRKNAVRRCRSGKAVHGGEDIGRPRRPGPHQNHGDRAGRQLNPGGG